MPKKTCIPFHFAEGKEVELVAGTKLLGLTIAKDLTWNDHVTEITKMADKRLS